MTVGATADWSAPVSAPYHAEGPYLAPFSSRGPTLDNRTKPDIVAPGQDVRTSWPTDTYSVVSGTSIATPHIVGVIALIDSAKPSLIGNVDAIEQLLDHTAQHFDSSECGSSGSHPNNLYGWGLVNAGRAAKP